MRCPLGAGRYAATVQRVAIVGNGGSGNLHVGRRLGALLDLPVIHLDAVCHDTSWTPAAAEAVAADPGAGDVADPP